MKKKRGRPPKNKTIKLLRIKQLISSVIYATAELETLVPEADKELNLIIAKLEREDFLRF